ncbi:sigma-70 family RNA polymerase sigma factor [Mycolicibacterium litorale]|uniref:sigma-70 family RNA polymerase sigma factor n=1 Tax=Mycolicibacterium litorale TaxID=758802 RepID=UPI003CEB5E51
MKSAATQSTSPGGNAVDDESATFTNVFINDVIPLRAELLRAAMRMTNRANDAEDLVQDTLVRAYRSFGTFTPGTNTRAWMHQILRNTWINNHRAAQRRPAEVLVDLLGEETSGHATASAEAAFLAGQPDSEVHTAMAALSDEFRTVVYLADVEGHPYSVVAEMMGTPVGTVMSRLHRARRQLRVLLGGTACRRRLVTAA